MNYTIDNPKLIEHFYFHEPGTFTGVVKDVDGNIVYYENGKIHRADGPAIISARGIKEWYINGKRHREDGPAFEDGSNKAWCYNDTIYGYDNDFTVESWIKKWNLEVFK